MANKRIDRYAAQKSLKKGDCFTIMISGYFVIPDSPIHSTKAIFGDATVDRMRRPAAQADATNLIEKSHFHVSHPDRRAHFVGLGHIRRDVLNLDSVVVVVKRPSLRIVHALVDRRTLCHWRERHKSALLVFGLSSGDGRDSIVKTRRHNVCGGDEAVAKLWSVVKDILEPRKRSFEARVALPAMAYGLRASR